MYSVRLDRFSSVDHLTKKQLQDDETVLTVLRQCKRVSTFELSASASVRDAIERLRDAGKITLTELPYPWHGVTINGP